MSTLDQRKSTSWRAALETVTDGLLPAETWTVGVEAVEPSALPRRPRDLLVHKEHMTVVLKKRFGDGLTLEVLQEKTEGTEYRRKILLRSAPAGQIVEFGVVRLDLSVVARDVRQEILARSAPLGEILIRHNVLRRVEPRTYLRFSGRNPLLAFFGPKSAGEAFGRIATIHYDHTPAIDLLEVVPGGMNGGTEPNAYDSSV